MLKVGFDLDGVLLKQGVIEWALINKNEELRKMYCYADAMVQITPQLLSHEDDELFILTGRESCLAEATIKVCNRHFPGIPVYFIQASVTWKDPSEFSDWFKAIAEAKAVVINKLKLDVYFEDMPETVIALRELCPNTKIIQYGGRLR